jgi:hypothetical protein
MALVTRVVFRVRSPIGGTEERVPVRGRWSCRVAGVQRIVDTRTRQYQYHVQPLLLRLRRTCGICISSGYPPQTLCNVNYCCSTPCFHLTPQNLHRTVQRKLTSDSGRVECECEQRRRDLGGDHTGE